MKVLVAYYSLTGHTQQVADQLATRCSAEVERVRDAGMQRTGLRGYLLSGWQACTGVASPIVQAKHRAADFDLVLIGTPVWNWSLCAPMRSYATAHAREFKRVAFFCTEGGSGERRVFAELQKICGQAPVATAVFLQKQVERGLHGPAMAAFVDKLGLH